MAIGSEARTRPRYPVHRRMSSGCASRLGEIIPRASCPARWGGSRRDGIMVDIAWRPRTHPPPKRAGSHRVVDSDGAWERAPPRGRGYSVMSISVVLRIDRHRRPRWPPRRRPRWRRVFPPRDDATSKPGEPGEPDLAMVTANAERLAEVRKRLANLSWFMRCLCEKIARAAGGLDAVGRLRPLPGIGPRRSPRRRPTTLGTPPRKHLGPRPDQRSRDL